MKKFILISLCQVVFQQSNQVITVAPRTFCLLKTLSTDSWPSIPKRLGFGLAKGSSFFLKPLKDLHLNNLAWCFKAHWHFDWLCEIYCNLLSAWKWNRHYTDWFVLQYVVYFLGLLQIYTLKVKNVDFNRSLKNEHPKCRLSTSTIKLSVLIDLGFLPDTTLNPIVYVTNTAYIWKCYLLMIWFI